MQNDSEDALESSFCSQPSKRRRSVFNFTDENAIDAEAEEVEEDQE